MSKKKTVSKSASRTAPALRKHKHPDYVVLVLALLGFALAAYLTYGVWDKAELPFCGKDSDCDIVQQSDWSRFGGLPIAFWGALLYLAIAWVAYRIHHPLTRWSWLLTFSSIGVGMSLYLTAVSVLIIEATCIYCLASLVILTLLLVISAWKYPRGVPEFSFKPWVARASSLTIVTVLVFGLYHSGLFEGEEDPYLHELAVHLRESGAKFYGAQWCPTCERQRDLFQASKSELPYVECSPAGRHGRTAVECLQQAISNYPTWIINGQRSTGFLTPTELASRSGFEAPATTQ